MEFVSCDVSNFFDQAEKVHPLTTKKSIECKAIIQNHSKDFGSSPEDPDALKLCDCSRNSYYKYKRELKT